MKLDQCDKKQENHSRQAHTTTINIYVIVPESKDNAYHNEKADFNGTKNNAKECTNHDDEVGHINSPYLIHGIVVKEAKNRIYDYGCQDAVRSIVK